MLNLEKERPANRTFGRTQWWRAGESIFLVQFDHDEKRCSIFLPEGDTEGLFKKTDLENEPGFYLETGIDCYAISCPSDRLKPTLETLAEQVF